MNKYKLSRNIPEPVKREVRQRCGFGCVICGSLLVEYEHFDPVYVDAREHKSSGITLLCPNCHTKKTNGLISRNQVIEANANPFCRKAGFAFGHFFESVKEPSFAIGSNIFDRCRTVIKVKNTPLLQLTPPRGPDEPYLINANFFDSSGKLALQIKNNEWKALKNTWDVTLSGREIAIKRAHRDIVLRVVLEPETALFRIEALDAQIHHMKFWIKNGELKISHDGLCWNTHSYMYVHDLDCGFRFD